jgi:hypothetical protein
MNCNHYVTAKTVSFAIPIKMDLIEVIFLVLELITFVVSIAGNLIVIYAMQITKKTDKKTSLYISALAITDLLIEALSFPFFLIHVGLKYFFLCIIFHLKLSLFVL